MTTFSHAHVSQAASYEQIEEAIKTVPMEEGVLPGEPSLEGLVDRAVRIYKGVRPILTTFTTITLFPSSWRKAVSLFVSAVDAIAENLEKTGDGFKAGKDL